jgi:hypothetical protein
MVEDELKGHDTPEKKPEQDADQRQPSPYETQTVLKRPEQGKTEEVVVHDATRADIAFDDKVRTAAADARLRDRIAKENAAMFHSQVCEFLARATPEQREVLRQELDKIEGVQKPAGLQDQGGETLGKMAQAADPHAQLYANEANKIASAEAAVRPVPRPVPAPGAALPGTVVWGETPNDATIDGLTYHKMGEQWRVHLGNVGGHDQYRWLSKQEAVTVGLEKEDPVPAEQDLGGGRSGELATGGVNRRIDQPGDYGSGLDQNKKVPL